MASGQRIDGFGRQRRLVKLLLASLMSGQTPSVEGRAGHPLPQLDFQIGMARAQVHGTDTLPQGRQYATTPLRHSKHTNDAVPHWARPWPRRFQCRGGEAAEKEKKTDRPQTLSTEEWLQLTERTALNSKQGLNKQANMSGHSKAENHDWDSVFESPIGLTTITSPQPAPHAQIEPTNTQICQTYW